MCNHLSVSEYKYGEFKGVEIIEFKTEKELIEWINDSVTFTENTIEEEKECGESLCKYKGRFSFDGVDHFIYLDF